MINKIDKPLANLTKMRRKIAQINKIRNEKWEITMKTNKIQGIIRDYLKTCIQINWRIKTKWTNL
jgi:hypothetical protein